jgi:hypothetical protein
MVSADLVTVTVIGNQKHYQANPDAPIFAELRGIVLKTMDLADVHHSNKNPKDLSHRRTAWSFRLGTWSSRPASVGMSVSAQTATSASKSQANQSLA